MAGIGPKQTNHTYLVAQISGKPESKHKVSGLVVKTTVAFAEAAPLSTASPLRTNTRVKKSRGKMNGCIPWSPLLGHSGPRLSKPFLNGASWETPCKPAELPVLRWGLFPLTSMLISAEDGPIGVG